ncbi:rhodanese-related sulfurtransferase [Candidatus Woesearchaeota archaeon]|nr:rhodanese-related sulfurtransferase [Candidatus Woesearchaeota archaeon]
MQYKVISLYKYADIKEPELLRDQLRDFCTQRGILGRILVSNEGINAAISGRIEQIEELKNFFLKQFKDITFREQKCEKNSYHKLVVRVRPEVVVFGEKVDLSKTGTHLSPKEFNEAVKDKDTIILDARNDFEYKVGKFKNAIDLGIEKFSEFPKAVKKIENLKDKKIVMYCTGGIRCEKASAFLKQKGFNHVYQLQGGIINYLNQFPEKNFEGACFVFDDRLVSKTGEPVSACELCGELTEEIINCHNLDCDKLFICCEECQAKMNKACCEECKNSSRQRKQKPKPTITIGKIENYYPKAKSALVKVEKELCLGEKITIKGKTTSVEEQVKELRDYDGNPISTASAGKLITLPVSKKVRRNDKVMVEV